MAGKNKNFFESPVWDFIELAGNAIGLNLLFIVCCIPIVTIGPACCGLYSAIRFYARKDGWFRGFKKGFTTHFFSIMIIWVIGAAAALYFGDHLLALIKNFQSGDTVMLVFLSVICALIVSFITSAIIYNVYFPRRFIDLVTESASFVFRAPLQLLISGALLWAPAVVLALFFGYIYTFVLVFIAIYFVVAVLASTMMIKNSLIKVLNEKRASGELPPLEKDEEDEADEK